MTIRQDNRLLDGAPMLPLRCHQCGTRVQVRKSSWHQTSIQWDKEAVDACLERRASTPGGGPNGDRFPACEALRQTIRQAVLDGAIPVPDDGL
ncbi:ferredoxin [Microtetraspora sp. AC03309]|uniref:ferredoxin n=1 Tax=Microtetraspora sp. AC03309 TaxID=2779376 RepID=UPI001E60C92D|nr:ferredoxin [Microtetraspora sp. AC03309]MCC5577996.1 ferredoxin [Microtetraspora sp. AC03309]